MPTADTDAGPTTTVSATSYMQPEIMGAFGKTIKYKKDSAPWKTRTDAVTKYMAKEMVSFPTVKKKSFKDMVKALSCLDGHKQPSHINITKLETRFKCCCQRRTVTSNN